MSKQQVIDAIRQVNRSAEQEMLDECDQLSLEQYLQRLRELNNHRGRTTIWVRPGGPTAFVRRMVA